MPIYYNEQTKEFHLQAKETSYIFTILRNNQLGHLYFGKKLEQRESFEHLYDTTIKATTGNELKEGETFHLDKIKQEFPAYGTTDFRQPGYQVLQENGSRITDFVYKEHRIYQGKPTLEGLPATYVEQENEAHTLEISLYDDLIDAEIILYYTVYENYNATVRSAKFINHGQQDVQLPRVMSASVDLFDSNFKMVHLSGAWSRERHVKERKLESGIQSVSSTTGASSIQQNPFLALKRPDATEDIGEVYGFSLVYSGNFLAQIEVDQYDVARVQLGINPFDFNWLLSPNESFQTPEVVMVYSDQGLNGMSQTYHNLYRKRLAKGKWRDKARPVLMNNWEGTYFDFDEEKIYTMAKQSKELGVELFVLDDGWFGTREDDTTSLGDWFVNKKKLPNGIDGLAKKINDLGIGFGLWFEPEMISKNSELYRKHPDWAIQVENRKRSEVRSQYVLDFSRKEVVDYIYKSMAKILEDAPISYVKWDMNRPMTEIGSAYLGADRQQELPHRYILGVYDLYDRLTTAFPHVLFESCASGGGRFDPGLLHYAPQGWTSDDTDAVERLKIQYGTSYAYPVSSMGAHVSAIPNHQLHRSTSLKMRGDVAYFGQFGYELDVTKMSTEEKEMTKRQIVFYKENRNLIHNGVFYRMESPFDGDGNVTSWMIVSENQDEAIVGRFQVLAKPNVGSGRILLKGLHPTYQYQVEGRDGIFLGAELMQAGIPIKDQIVSKTGDYSSEIYRLVRVNRGPNI
ncbi:alpha-galactosidase [Aquibacillus koreensis]|uniref:Alpha-galactosidase n=1 Tax=Aquibacillus koreensis TaxID=279446 RepID=A0A9X3WI75_9BACI|nr:alpha-galactosidase [Aquibacillus koreensis]MCT2535976.1 alpha-galactosidase [Aquibacillus koreensis]MDC3420432.1 alpha-galactosidase [Aquibacillus koreensis]